MPRTLDTKGRLTALLAVVVSTAAVAAATPADASAGMRWSDGASSQVDIHCRSYGLGATNVEISHRASGSGLFYIQFWIRDLSTGGSWQGPSDYLAPGSYAAPQRIARQWQFYVRLWHRLPSGQWVWADEYGYVHQNGIVQMEYGGACTT